MTPPNTETRRAGNEATILVEDDIAANCNLLRETLEPRGYEVLFAHDGETALKLATQAQPDLILLDVMMPGWTGFETYRRLKQSEATRAISSAPTAAPCFSMKSATCPSRSGPICFGC